MGSNVKNLQLSSFIASLNFVVNKPKALLPDISQKYLPGNLFLSIIILDSELFYLGHPTETSHYSLILALKRVSTGLNE